MLELVNDRNANEQQGPICTCHFIDNRFAGPYFDDLPLKVIATPLT